MIENPHIAQTEDASTALIHSVIPRPQMPSVIGPALKELQIAITAQGLKATGPWFAHHLSLSAETFDFEVCLPVDGVFAAVGRAVPGKWPAGTVARATYRGDYAGLPAAWEELRAWIDAQGQHREPHIYERYLVTPPTHADSSDWLTEMSWPLLV